MKKTGHPLLLLFALTLSHISFGQIPVNDPAWQLQPGGTSGGTEEFNSTLDYTNKWFDQYPWGDYSLGAEIDLPANLIQTGTTLKIKVDTLIPNVTRPNTVFNNTTGNVTIAYQGGCLQSQMQGGSDVYKYGYLEIYAKYPTSYYAYWPAFWLWSAACTPVYYNEIDICENGAFDSYPGTHMGTNNHLHLSGSCANNDLLNTENYLKITGLPLLSSAFHKYAIEWAPDRMIYYFDDVAVRTIYDPTGALIPQHSMAVILNFAWDPYAAYLPSDWNNTKIFPLYPKHNEQSPVLHPQYFEIDYLRYYKLNTDCSTNLTICTPGTDYSARAVEKSITTGGSSGCTPTFNPTTTANSWTLRATDFIQIAAGTTINPSGTGYVLLETMPCPQ
jgi:beta-glucanase (GH16 family)